MTIDQAIQNMCCQMKVIVKHNGYDSFNGTIGDLSSQYLGLGQEIVISGPRIVGDHYEIDY